MVLSDEKKLREGARAFDVRRDEAEDIVMAEGDGLVELRLSIPTRFLRRVEDLNSEIIATPLTCEKEGL